MGELLLSKAKQVRSAYQAYVAKHPLVGKIVAAGEMIPCMLVFNVQAAVLMWTMVALHELGHLSTVLWLRRRYPDIAITRVRMSMFHGSVEWRHASRLHMSEVFLVLLAGAVATMLGAVVLFAVALLWHVPILLLPALLFVTSSTTNLFHSGATSDGGRMQAVMRRPHALTKEYGVRHVANPAKLKSALRTVYAAVLIVGLVLTVTLFYEVHQTAQLQLLWVRPWWA